MDADVPLGAEVAEERHVEIGEAVDAYVGAFSVVLGLDCSLPEAVLRHLELPAGLVDAAAVHVYEPHRAVDLKVDPQRLLEGLHWLQRRRARLRREEPAESTLVRSEMAYWFTRAWKRSSRVFR